MILPNVGFTKKQNEFRLEVRGFIEEELQRGSFEQNCDSWLSGFSMSFSKKLAKRGWIGITWPEEYGGGGRDDVERYILIEELLAYGAPIAAHWVADRQLGPLLLTYGTEEQKNFYLPKITKGECYFSIGLSEPNSGSDLASIRTSAKRIEGGWILNGSKTWTSGAHKSHYITVLCRTSPYDNKNRHAGMSQLIVDLSSEGISIGPIEYLTGEKHFNEIFFENVFVPEDNLIGTEGNGWGQSMTELAYERSGPERILSTVPLLEELINVLRERKDAIGIKRVTKLFAELYNLRKMSIGVSRMLTENQKVDIVAALVKDLGTQFERKIPEVVQALVEVVPSVTSEKRLERLLAQSVLHSPGFTLRGGSTEILRGIVAKGLIER